MMNDDHSSFIVHRLKLVVMIKFLLVFLGGGAGSLLRYGLALWLGPVQGRFPWATLAANALACFILGWVGALALQYRLSEEQRLLLATGLCGGFSTFSTFTAESWRLYEQGNLAFLLLNVFMNLAVCMLCLLLGTKMPNLL